MRIECRKYHRNNVCDVKTAAAGVTGRLEPGRSPRVVPRMGTKLDYLRQLQVLQQLNAMSSWARNDKINQERNANISAAAASRNNNVAYCVSKLNACDVTAQTQTDSSDYASIASCTGATAEYKELSSNTSAYNTGESCVNTPLEADAPPAINDGGGGWNMSMLSLAVSNVHSEVRPPLTDDEELKLDWCRNNSLLKNGSRNANARSQSSRTRFKDGQKCPMVAANQAPGISHVTKAQTDNLRELYTQYADVMYTNQANLQHTMRLQQKLFQQQLLVQQAQQRGPQAQHGPKAQQCGPQSPRDKTPQAHARTPDSSGDSARRKPQSANSSSKKKHRSQTSSVNIKVPVTSSQSQTHKTDATPERYYTPSTRNLSQLAANTYAPPPTSHQSPRPERSEKYEWVVKMRPDGTRYITRRLVRSKILRERARQLHEERCGMTTDDDAMSELKVGRYWSKDERKRHLEKAREYRKKKEQAQKSRADAAREAGDKANNQEANAFRKAAKSRNKRTLDDFTTVQEMLVHGSRHADVAAKTSVSPLLSVTTV